MGRRVSMYFRMGAGYAERCLRSPRSKRRFVEGGALFPVKVCRNESEGTVRRAEREIRVMIWWFGSVNVPLWRAEMVT